MKKMVLASGSTRRKELLDQINAEYEAVPSDYDEDGFDFSGDVFAKTEQLALLKAKAVAVRYAEGGTVVVGADTIVLSDGVIFGKPTGREDARRMLRSLSGHSHVVLTGLAAIDTDTGNEYLSHEITKVRFTDLTEEDITSYLDTNEYVDKAGAYAIQGTGALLVERIDGCYENVVGLPLLNLHKLLIRAGHPGLMGKRRK